MYKPIYDTFDHLHLIQSSLSNIHQDLPRFIDTTLPLPNVGLIYKCHKSTFRPITVGSHCAFTNVWMLCQALTSFFISMLPNLLLHLSNAAVHKFGQRMFPLWMVKDALHAKMNAPPLVSSLFDLDIKSCFDYIPTDPSSPRNITSCIQWIMDLFIRFYSSNDISFTIYSNLQVRVSVTLPITTSLSLSGKQIVHLFDTITNMTACASVFNISYLQVSGIPQGAHMSPDLCNLFLTYCEVLFLLYLPNLVNTDKVITIYKETK